MESNRMKVFLWFYHQTISTFYHFFLIPLLLLWPKLQSALLGLLQSPCNHSLYSCSSYQSRYSQWSSRMISLKCIIFLHATVASHLNQTKNSQSDRSISWAGLSKKLERRGHWNKSDVFQSFARTLLALLTPSKTVRCPSGLWGSGL